MDSSENLFAAAAAAAGRSNFSHTCNRLSQFLKAKGSFGELTLGLTPNPAAEPKGTMNLLPKIEKSDRFSVAEDVDLQMSLLSKVAAAGEGNISGLTGSGQMTIFYGGQVVVFNDMKTDKAREVITLAGKCSAAHNRQYTAFPLPKPAESTTGSPTVFPIFASPELGGRLPQPSLVSDLPLSRKNSLARFLEKRKDRITAKAPYQATKSAAVPVKNEPRLGAGPQLRQIH